MLPLLTDYILYTYIFLSPNILSSNDFSYSHFIVKKTIKEIRQSV